MFLAAVEGKEIIDTVYNCKNKASSDFNKLDTTVMKRVGFTGQ